MDDGSGRFDAFRRQLLTFDASLLLFIPLLVGKNGLLDVIISIVIRMPSGNRCLSS
jgi:hypothetical protein